MRVLLKIVALVLLALVLVGAAGYAWVSHGANRALSRSYEAHSVDFPVPFPLEEAERGALGLTEEEAQAVALERAMERGRHLLDARYPCADCHGEDFGGGVMVDAFPIGRLLGPNLTSGRGGRTADYAPEDWDRIVRHGILPDGRPSVMPSEDFRRMSDQELSDIIVYLRSRPPVDHEVAPVSLGPLGKFLVASGEIELSADVIEAHHGPHARMPPEAEVDVEFGGHLASVCAGCHGVDLAGGQIAGGDPSWPPASNLTPVGLGSWTYADFEIAMREAARPDGSALREPMASVAPYARRMTDVEMEALWSYLRSLDPVEG